jgi:hypothetical protein
MSPDKLTRELAKPIESRSVKTPRKRKGKKPTFTDDELKCIAWAFGSLAWVPARWRESTDTVAKKLRAYLGDDAVSEKAKP